MTYEDSEVRDFIAQSYGRELAACDALGTITHEIAVRWEGRLLPPEAHGDHILAVIFARSYTTYSAAVALVRDGFAEQASMLTRSLFEDMVDAHWITLNPALATERLNDHHEHGRMLLADSVRAHDGFLDDADLPEFDPDERNRLADVYGRYGDRSWTGLSMYSRVRAIEQTFDDSARENLHFFRRFVQRENNGLLHMGAPAVAKIVGGIKDGGLHVRYGRSASHVDKALLGAFWTLGQLDGLILEHFEFPPERRDALDDAYGGQLHVFKTLTADDLGSLGRNDPCPCGSGRKFKRCHGA